MSTNQDDIELRLSAEIAELTRSLRVAQTQIVDLERTTRQASTGIQRSIGGMSRQTSSLARLIGASAEEMRAFGRVVSVISNPITLLAGGVALLAQQVISLEFVAARANRRMETMNAVIIATGGSSGVTALEVTKFARSIGEELGAPVRQLEIVSARILSFKRISADAFPRVLKLSQDLTNLGFGPLDLMAENLAKTIANPTEEMSSLQEVGVFLKESTKDLVRELEAENDILGAQEVLLKAVSDQVGNVSKRISQDVIGEVQRLRNNWTLMRESMAKVKEFKTAETAIGALNFVIKALSKNVIKQADSLTLLQNTVMPNLGLLRAMGAELRTTGDDGELLMGNIDAMAASLKSWGVIVSDSTQIKDLRIQLVSLTATVKTTEASMNAFASNGFTAEAEKRNVRLKVQKEELKRVKDELNLLLTAEDRAAAARKARAELDAAQEISDAAHVKALKLISDGVAARANSQQKLTDAMFPAEAATRAQAVAIQFLQDQIERGEGSKPELLKTIEAIQKFGIDGPPTPKKKKKDREVFGPTREDMNQMRDAFDERQKTLDESALKKLESLTNSQQTEREMIISAAANELAIIDDTIKRKLKSEEDMVDAKIAIKKKETSALTALEKRKNDAILSASSQAANAVMSLTQGRSRALFNISKAASAGIATVSGISAVNKAFETGGFPLAIPTAIATAANVASILATPFGGAGGGSARSSGSGSSTPNAVSAPNADVTGVQATEVSINLGDDDELITARGVRKLLQRIDEEIRNGAVTGLQVT